LRHSVVLDDQDAGAFNTLGLLLKRKGDEAGAEKAFARAAVLRAEQDQAKQKKLRQGAAKINPASNP
jgi:Flp pilus assembly protein TadD